MRFSASPTSKMPSWSQVKKVDFFTILALRTPPPSFEGPEAAVKPSSSTQEAFRKLKQA